MGLTEEGKQAAYEFGKGILSENQIRFYSSPAPRCIETSELIEKGFLSTGGKSKSNTVLNFLGGLYFKDPEKTLKIIFEFILKGEYPSFFRKWFTGELPDDLMEDSLQTAQTILKGSYKLIQESERVNHICITHDVNLYLLKEYYLNQKPEEYAVDYLEGLIIYKENNAFHIINHVNEEKLPELF
jgi:broad specificity phosphatase PhoE